MLFLVFCLLGGEATSGHRSPPSGWSGACFLVVWPGIIKPGGQEAGCLDWEADRLANWCVSREQADCLDGPVLQPPLLPTERPLSASRNIMIYDSSSMLACGYTCFPFQDAKCMMN